MMMKKIGFLVMMVALAGCSKPAPDPNIAACPERTILILQKNQAFMENVKAGETSAKDLKKLKGLTRKATLEKGGESMKVSFYQTGLPRCPWVLARESQTPVVIKDDVIQSVGGQALKDLTAKGWVLKESTWPWQRYDFGYLPVK